MRGSGRRQRRPPGNKLVQYIQVAICGCLDGRRTLSSKIEDNTEFKSTQEIMLHFSSQFEEGMTWEQHSHQGWNIGHRIAKNHYDFSIDEDLKRCWKSANLFPQWATGPTGNCRDVYKVFLLRKRLLRAAPLLAHELERPASIFRCSSRDGAKMQGQAKGEGYY